MNNIDDIKFYLKSNLRKPSLNFEWTDKDNKNFFEYIRENYPKDFLHTKENLLLIRKAFAEYFENIGYILFKINNHHVRLKIFQYSQDFKQHKSVDKIINILDENKDDINFNYNGKNDQIYLNKQLKNEIFEYVKTIENGKINTKELVRYSIRKGLKLKDKDLIILKKESIFVKLCDMTKRLLDENNQPLDRRFNSIDEQEMISFNQEHFKNKENNDFFFITAKLFVEKYFLEKNISNLDYEKKVFALIQLTIMEQLMDKFDRCEEFFKGFAGYIFRRNFISVFEYIAELILHEVSNMNDYIIDFLRYYSLNIIVLNGQRYITPKIETDGGLRWNVSSMLSIVKLYFKAQESIQNTQKSIDDINFKLMKLHINGLTPMEFNKKNNQQKDILISQLIAYERTIDKCYDSLVFAKTEVERIELETQIELTKDHMKGIKEEKKELEKKAIHIRQVNEFIEIEKKLTSLERAIKKENSILQKNKKSFEAIKIALVKALISKKTLA